MTSSSVQMYRDNVPGQALRAAALGQACRTLRFLSKVAPESQTQWFRHPGALGEARTRSGFRGARSKKHVEANTIMAELADELQVKPLMPADPTYRSHLLSLQLLSVYPRL